MKFVRRVGERIAEDLAKRGVETVEDLLYHLPFRYEDRLHIQPIAELKADTMASVIGEVRGQALLETRAGPLFELTVGQGVHSVKAVWFRGAYLKERFKPGQMVALYGKLEASRSNAGKFKMIQPQFEDSAGGGSQRVRVDRRQSLRCSRWGGSCRCTRRLEQARERGTSSLRSGCVE